MSKCHIAMFAASLFASHAAADPGTMLDPTRGYRWELHGATVSLHAIGGGLIREVRLPGAIFASSRDASPPDMLVMPRTGELIVASNATPRLWRVHPTRREMQVYDIELAAERDKDFGFSALAAAPDERTLYARSSTSSTAWRIDLGTQAARPLTPAETAAAGYRAR